MRQVIVNGKVVDFLQAALVRHKVSPGCSAFNNEQQQQQQQQKAAEEEQGRQQSSPCERQPCKHGRCKNISAEPGYRCRCQDGYTGNHCDIRGELTDSKT